jgi:hypothetical protein
MEQMQRRFMILVLFALGIIIRNTFVAGTMGEREYQVFKDTVDKFRTDYDI